MNSLILIASLYGLAIPVSLQDKQETTITIPSQYLLGAPRFSRDSALLAYMEENGEIVLYDLKTRRSVRRLSGLVDPKRNNFGRVMGGGWKQSEIAFSPDSTLLAACHQMGTTFAVWKVATGELVGKQEADNEWIGAVTFSPTGKTLITTGYQGVFRFWSVNSDASRVAESEADTVFSMIGSWNSVDVRPGFNVMAVGATSKGFTLVDLDTRKAEAPIDLREKWFAIGIGTAFSPDGKLFAVATFSGGTPTEGKAPGLVRIWDVDKKEVRTAITQPGSTAYSVSFASDAKSVAVSWCEESLVRSVAIYDVSSGKLIRKLGEQLYFPAYSPDGKWLAANGVQKVLLWQLRR